MSIHLKWSKGAKLLISLCLIVWLLTKVDWLSAIKAIGQARPVYVLIAVSLLSLSQVVVAQRLRYLLNLLQYCPSLWYVVKLTFCGLFVGNFLPTTIGGDAVRVYLLNRANCSPENGIAAILMDRLLNLALLLFILAATALFSPRLIPWPTAAWISLLCLGSVVAGILFMHFWTKVSTKKTLAREENRFKSKMLSWLTNTNTKLGTIYHRLNTTPAAKLRVLVLSISSLMAGFLACWLVTRDLAPTVSFFECITIIGLANLLSMLPISLSGLGVQEVSLTLLFSRLGVPETTGLALALLLRAVFMLSSLPGLIWWFTGVHEVMVGGSTTPRT